MILPGFKGTHSLRSVILDTAVNMVFQELTRRFPTDTFENVTRISSGSTPSRSDSSFYGGDIPWIKISDITAAGKYIEDTEEYITQLALDNSSTNLFPVGTVLFSMYGSIGKTCILRKQMTTNQAILGLIPSAKITSEYLYYALHGARAELFQSAKGTSQKNINASMVRRHVIPVPPREIMDSITAFLAAFEAGEPLENIQVPPFLEEQRRIVARVEALAARIEEARGLRDTSIEHGDRLVVSMAHREDLSEVEKLEQGWVNIAVGDVLKLSQERHTVKFDAEYPNLGMLSFAKGLFSKPPISGATTSAPSLYKVKKNQFIYSRLFAFEGAYGIVNDEFDGRYVSSEYPTFDCDPVRARAEFFLAYLKSPKTWALVAMGSKGLGDRRKRIQPEQFLEFRLMLPPLEWQNRIALTLNTLERLKKYQTATRLELDALLPSVLAKAFAGEL